MLDSVDIEEELLISLGNIKVVSDADISSCQKKLYWLFHEFSFNTYDATLMVSLFSEFIKECIKKEDKIIVQIGFAEQKPIQLIIRFKLKSEVSSEHLKWLSSVFNITSSTIDKGIYQVDFKTEINDQVVFNSDFIISIIKKVETRSTEELLEELKESNRNLNVSLGQFGEVNAELEAFSYTVSHDLRAPLRHMVGFAELLKKNLEGSDEKSQRFLNNILESSKRMGMLIDDLLGFSRTGRAAITLKTLNINEIIKGVKTELISNVNGQKIEWIIHDFPSSYGDQTLIRLVFQNLTSSHFRNMLIRINQRLGDFDKISR